MDRIILTTKKLFATRLFDIIRLIISLIYISPDGKISNGRFYLPVISILIHFRLSRGGPVSPVRIVSETRKSVRISPL